MKIVITWNWDETQNLFNNLNLAIWELWIDDFVKSEISNDEALNLELWIQKQPALVIIEESIDFKDMIFEGIVPEITDLKWMLISIVWGWDSCWSWGCGTCSSSWECGI